MSNESIPSSKRLIEMLVKRKGQIDVTRLALGILSKYDKDRVEQIIPETNKTLITDNRNYWITKRKVNGYDSYNVKLRLQTR